MLTIDGIIYSLQRHGGITVYFNELLQRASASGLAVRTLVYGGGSEHASRLPGQVETRELRIGERYRKCYVPIDAQLFHSSYYRRPTRAIPTVTTVHDFTYERLISGVRRWVHSSQKFSAIRSSQAVICISESTRSDLFHFLPKFPPERVHVIPNGVGEDFYPLASSLAGGGPQPFIVFVGARGGYKNFRLVVEAIGPMADFELVCVGGGPVSWEEADLINQHLPGRCSFLADIPNKILNELYNKACCLAYPSAYEGFGIPILEAMRAGCPVVAFRGSSIPEVAGDAALLIDRLTAEALREAIRKASDQELRSELKKRGFRQAACFSWQRTFEQTVDLYELVVGKPLQEYA